MEFRSSKSLSSSKTGFSLTVRETSSRYRQNMSVSHEQREEAEKYVQGLEGTVNDVEDMMRRLASGLTTIKEGIPAFRDCLGRQHGVPLEDYKETMKKLADADETIHDLRKNNEEFKLKFREKDEELKKKDTELKRTQTRLSEVMGNKLIDRNPDIADLSDQNRASKLAEKFSELYDNEWTEAFEGIRDKMGYDDSKCVEVLYNILMKTYEHCSDRWIKYERRYRQAITGSKDLDIPDYINKQLKDITKSFAPNFVEDVYGEFIRIYMENETIFMSEGVPSFLKGCIRICWLMAAQDPPVVFNTQIKASDTMDTSILKPYTQIGDTILFVVWPPMLLHEGGPLLVKGVAQAIKTAINRPQSAPAKFGHGKAQRTQAITISSIEEDMKTGDTALNAKGKTMSVKSPTITDDAPNYHQTVIGEAGHKHEWVSQSQMPGSQQPSHQNYTQNIQLNGNYYQWHAIGQLNLHPQPNDQQNITWMHDRVPSNDEMDRFQRLLCDIGEPNARSIMGDGLFNLCRDYNIYMAKRWMK